MEEQAKKIADLFKLLANEHRLLILCALLKGPLGRFIRSRRGSLHPPCPSI